MEVVWEVCDRIELLVRVHVFFGLNVRTFVENQAISMCYEIITKWPAGGPDKEV